MFKSSFSPVETVDVETVVEVAVVVMEMAVVVVAMNEVQSRRRWMWRPLAVVVMEVALVAMNEAQSSGSGGGGYHR
ncbi:hypothetical protein F2Q69_00014842 [Brassica cretica]|uniref:Uncharacterized protein n=1 Tax=Brassica cretica TaxID=69181 RepID=A0A8S9R1C3_BRACR|nr:hypothetical protein F2Q69_00014842 [Brassica cretica]